MRPQPYPKYKPSGVEWLREVPEHWDVKAIKWESPVLRGASPRPIDNDIYFDEKGEYAWVRIADVSAAGMYLHETMQRLSNLGRSLSVSLQPGTLFLSIAGTVGKPCITAIKCCIHDGFVYFPFWCGESRFLYYLFASGESYRGLGKLGTQLNLNTDTVGSIIAGFPEPLEQRAIADFLDRETVKIDTLVAKKRTLIERLNEKRAALISRTVTRGLPPDAACAAGLDPHPSLKPSGIDWLGDVPEHWELAKLSRVTVSRCDGPFGSGLKSEHYTEGKGIRVVRLQNIRFAEFDDRDIAFIEPEYYRELGDHDVFAGDVLIAGLGDENNPVGRACVAPPALGPAMVKADCFRFRVDRTKVDAAYVALQLSATAYGLAGALASGTTRSRMNLSATATRVVAIPPLIEQISIVSFLSHETAEIDSLITKLETAIERLHEYRAALITEAVTGKIDVRGAVVPEEDAA